MARQERDTSWQRPRGEPRHVGGVSENADVYPEEGLCAKGIRRGCPQHEIRLLVPYLVQLLTHMSKMSDADARVR